MLRRIAKILAYTAAALTVLLAIAVGLLRIALPQVPEYRDEIIARLSEAVDGDVSFDRLDARWRLRGPELVFHDVVIGERLGERRIRAIEVTQITVGVSLGRLLTGRELEVRRIGITGAALDLRRDDAGWWFQDALILPVANAGTDVAGGEDAVQVPQGLQLPLGDALDLSLEDVALRYEDRGNGREPLSFDLLSAGVRLDGRELRVDATMSPDGDDARVSVLVTGALADRNLDGLIGGDWSLSTDVEQVSADLMRRILPPNWRLPQSGRTDVEADAELRGGALLAAVVTLDAERLVPPDGGDESIVAGRIEWSSSDDGWLLAVSDFVVGVADRQWPAANLTLQFESGAGADTLRVDAANVTVYDVPYLASFLPGRWAQALLDSGVSGTLRQGNGQVRFAPDQNLDSLGLKDLIDYEVDAAFDGIGLAASEGRPGASNLTGALRATREAGRLQLDTRDATLQVPGVFSADIAVDRVDGTLVWRASDRGISVLSDALQVAARGFEANANLQVLLPGDGAAPEVDLQADWSIDDIARARSLLPDGVMKPKLTDWLNRALVAGRINDGSFELRGSLDQFPFDESPGVFRMTGRAQGVTLAYGRGWPAITSLSADVVLDGMRLSTERNRGLSGNVPFQNARVAFEDLRTAVLDINATGNAALETLYIFVGDSPVRRLFGEQYARMSFAGGSEYDISMQVPLRDVRSFTIDATIDVNDATFALDYIPHAVTELVGQVRIDRQGVYAEDATGVLLGQPLRIDMAPEGTPEDGQLVIRGRGRIDAAALIGPLGLPLEGRAEGATPFEAVVNLPRRRQPLNATDAAPETPRRPVTVVATSDLAGLAIDLPYPAGKAAEEVFAADARMTISDTLDLQAGLANRIDIALRAARDGDAQLVFDRMTLHLGEGRALLPSVPGVFIDGNTDRLRLGDWLSLQLADTGWMTDNLVSAAVEVADLFVVGQRIRDVRASLERSGDDWLVDVQSEAIEGAISIPRDLRGGSPVVLDMRKLHLLEADPEASGDADPTAFPPLRVRAASFALGDQDFGALDATIDKVADGLEVSRIATAAPAFRIEGEGAWRLAPGVEAGSRTVLTAELTSTDVKRMMNSLGYEPGINAAELESAFDVAWDGGPSATFVASLDGEVSVRISNGTLDDVEPGAGRVVGLMSVAELPRRLALDFRDVFQKGFNFDEIVGDFRLVNGDAYTCNLRLAGPSADVALIGRASLDRRNYNQTAVVGVKVGNTLPAVGAVVAGPQVGAALLLFSQIFKKPLQGMTQVYYQINGSWDEPGIERTDAERFVATSEMAGCAVETGG
ncbi:MAG: YhdP family protein [Pseudomonadota bacterium]